MTLISGRNKTAKEEDGVGKVVIQRQALCRFGLTVALLLLAGTVEAGKVFYIVEDAKGNTRMFDTLPPEYAQKGYRIVNERGVTVEVVAPAGKHNLPVYRLTDHDRALLATFQSVEEIVAARDRQLAELDAIIDATSGTMSAFERNLVELEAQADDLARQGQAVPEKTRSDIDMVRGQIARNQAYIEKKRAEQHETRERYEQDIERFRVLKKAKGG